MLQAVRQVNGRILWANLHLLFWLSLVPFVTGWMGENHFAAVPVALYGVVLLMAAIAYYILSRALIRHHGGEIPLSPGPGERPLGGESSRSFFAASFFFSRWGSLWAASIFFFWGRGVG